MFKGVNVQECKNNYSLKEVRENIHYKYISVVIMNSIAAAKKRRAPPSINEPPPLQNRQMNSAGPTPPINPNALTLPQVINIVDKRLIALEIFMKDTKAASDAGSSSASASGSDSTINHDDLETILQEFGSRFDILAEEIGNLKDIVMKLQTYTMDVNKMLLDERIHILSDIDNTSDPTANNNSITLNENIKLDEDLVTTLTLSDELQG